MQKPTLSPDLRTVTSSYLVVQRGDRFHLSLHLVFMLLDGILLVIDILLQGVPFGAYCFQFFVKSAAFFTQGEDIFIRIAHRNVFQFVDFVREPKTEYRSHQFICFSLIRRVLLVLSFKRRSFQLDLIVILLKLLAASPNCLLGFCLFQALSTHGEE